jgi:hypothetical protein
MKWIRIGSQVINGCQVGWQRRGDEYQSYLIDPDGGSVFITAWSMQEAQKGYLQMIERAECLNTQ